MFSLIAEYILLRASSPRLHHVTEVVQALVGTRFDW